MMACNIADGDPVVDLLLSKEADVNTKSEIYLPLSACTENAERCNE